MSRTRPAQAVLLLLGLAGCGARAPHLLDGVLPDVSLHFHVLDGQLVPGGLADDGTAKDVSLKTRAAFKPGKGGPKELASRMRLKAKADGGSARFASELVLDGDASAQVRVAADSVAGLLDDSSLGFLERRPDEGAVVRAEAVWNAGIDGFTCRATVDGTPAGATLDLPGAREVNLFLVDLGSSLSVRAAEASGDAPGEASAATELHQLAQDGSDDAARYGVGADELGPKGALWFAQFALSFPFDVQTGPAEAEVNAWLAPAWLDLHEAAAGIAGPAPHDAVALLGSLSDAFFELDNPAPGDGALAVLKAAVDGGTLLPTTKGKLALSGLSSARNKVFALTDQADPLAQQGLADCSALRKPLEAAIAKLEAAIAACNGFQSLSAKKLHATLDVELAD